MRHFAGGMALAFFIASLVYDVVYHVPSGVCEFADKHILSILIYSLLGGVAASDLLS